MHCATEMITKHLTTLCHVFKYVTMCIVSVSTGKTLLLATHYLCVQSPGNAKEKINITGVNGKFSSIPY